MKKENHQQSTRIETKRPKLRIVRLKMRGGNASDVASMCAYSPSCSVTHSHPYCSVFSYLLRIFTRPKGKKKWETLWALAACNGTDTWLNFRSGTTHDSSRQWRLRCRYGKSSQFATGTIHTAASTTRAHHQNLQRNDDRITTNNSCPSFWCACHFSMHITGVNNGRFVISVCRAFAVCIYLSVCDALFSVRCATSTHSQ